MWRTWKCQGVSLATRLLYRHFTAPVRPTLITALPGSDSRRRKRLRLSCAIVSPPYCLFTACRADVVVGATLRLAIPAKLSMHETKRSVSVTDPPPWFNRRGRSRFEVMTATCQIQKASRFQVQLALGLIDRPPNCPIFHWPILYA